jgi:pimeloyl-ACP methyl ester carboxylesterase
MSADDDAVAIDDGQFADLTNGTRLHYARAGSARGRKLMVFLHGFPEAWFTWEAQLAEFGRDHLAVAPDLRGFNLSSKPADPERYHIKHIAEDIRLLIEYLGYASAIVVCHDWGGAVGWHLGIFHPELVERLIVVNSPHPWLFMRELAQNPVQQAASAYMNWLRKPGSEEALVADRFAVVERFLQDEKGTMPDWYTPTVRDRYRAMWSVPGAARADGTPSHAMTGGCNFYRATPLRPPSKNEPARPLPDAAEWQTRVPVRVIWGETDRALTTGLIDGLDQVCPDLRVERIPEGSHWVVHEQPGRVNALIRGFIADQVSVASR